MEDSKAIGLCNIDHSFAKTTQVVKVWHRVKKLNTGIARQPKWGHLKELHKAIKLCEAALVNADLSYTSLGSGLESVLGIILGGGVGTRLYPLTKKREKPIVPFGANYRLIDIPISNCINNKISKIYVLTRFNSTYLNCHLSQANVSNMGSNKDEGFVEVLAAQQSPENPNWFQAVIVHQIQLLASVTIFTRMLSKPIWIVEAYEKLMLMERQEDNQSTHIDELEVNIVMDQY